MATITEDYVSFEIEADDISYINLAVINSITSEILEARVKNVIEI